MNLFSVFDIFLYKYIYIFFLLSIFIFYSFWMFNFKILLMNYFYNFSFKFFSSLKISKNSKNMIIMNSHMFLLFMMLNLMGIFPYYFSLSSQLTLVLLFSIFNWFMINSFMIMKNSKSFLIHTIPEGTPTVLIPFLFLIELVSNFIRPFTLCLRLVGNMVAGHIFLSLLFMLLKNFSLLNMVLYTGYFGIEMVICMLQSYIMFTLIYMYYSEI